jgi:hypothetical protein
MEDNNKKIIEGLVRGLETWARDEDGVHYGAWEAYVEGKKFLGEAVPSGMDGARADDDGGVGNAS